MLSRPEVTVVVPARNEEQHIRACLESLLAQVTDFSTEILVVDGESDDRTREVVRSLATVAPVDTIRTISNPNRTAPHAMNMGIAQARGSVIVRLDGHAIAPVNFIDELVKVLRAHSDAGCAGPRIHTFGHSRWGRAIAAAMSDPAGVGTSHFRTGGGPSGERDVDTVAFGAYQKDIFTEIGDFDTTLTRNQDDELNGRVRAGGFRVLLVPGVVVEYHCRETLRGFARQFFEYGVYKPLVGARLRRPATLRQFAPPALLLILATSVIGIVSGKWRLALPVVGYFGALYARGSLRSDDRVDNMRFAVACAVGHVSYGLGYWIGVFRLVRSRGGHTTSAHR